MLPQSAQDQTGGFMMLLDVCVVHRQIDLKHRGRPARASPLPTTHRSGLVSILGVGGSLTISLGGALQKSWQTVCCRQILGPSRRVSRQRREFALRWDWNGPATRREPLGERQGLDENIHREAGIRHRQPARPAAFGDDCQSPARSSQCKVVAGQLVGAARSLCNAESGHNLSYVQKWRRVWRGVGSGCLPCFLPCSAHALQLPTAARTTTSSLTTINLQTQHHHHDTHIDVTFHGVDPSLDLYFPLLPNLS